MTYPATHAAPVAAFSIPSWLAGLLIGGGLRLLCDARLGWLLFRIAVRASTRASRLAARFLVSDRVLILAFTVFSTALLMLLGYGYPG